MSLYGQYIKERAGRSIIETDRGFATYLFLDDGNCYLEDIFVTKEYRRSGEGLYLANAVMTQAKEHGSEWLIGSLDPTTNGAADSLKAQLWYGLEPFKINSGLLFLRKKV